MLRKMMLAVTLLTLLLVGLVPATRAAVPPTSFELRNDPVALLASYYNAIARMEYDRAYSYWENTPESAVAGQTPQQFAAGFAQTADIAVYVRVPAREGVGAGNIYADIPVLIYAVLTNGTQQYFVGCITAHKVNVPVGNATQPDPNWSLRSAKMRVAPSLDLTLLNTACPVNVGVNMADGTNASYAYDATGTPISALVSYFNAVARREYNRAYAYWVTPPANASLQQFSNGYANTNDVFVYVKLDIRVDGNGDVTYTRLPVFLVGVQPDGSGQYFAGCYVLRAINPPTGSPDMTFDWRMFSGTLKPVAKMFIGIEEMKCA